MRINKSLIAYTPTTGTGSGSVTSVGFSATTPTGLSASVSGSPITSAGTIALSLSFAAGYAIPTTIKQSNWDDAYTFVVNFPSQTGNNGMYLTTDGSAMSWAAISGTNITGAAISTANDTNVQITASGNTTNALLRTLTLTAGWTGSLAAGRGGTGTSGVTGIMLGNATAPVTGITGIGGQILRANPSTGVYEFWTPTYMQNPMSALGQIIYSNASGAPLALNANSTANNMYLRSVSSGTPSWASIQGGDIVGAGLSRTNDTNVQITLGGATTDGLLRAITLTMGWTGQLAVGRGGTGASTLTGVVIGNNSSAMTAVAGTANQLLRRNNLNTAYEFFTPSFPTGSGTTNYVPKWTSANVLGDSQIRDTGTFVGIGIAPSYKLDVNGGIGMSNLPLIERTGNYTNYYDTNSVSVLNLGNATAAANLYSNTTHTFRNRGGSATYLTIDSIGISVTGSVYMSGSVLTGSWQASVISPTYGGTGASSITGVVIGSGVSTMVGVAGTAGQLLRRNTLNTAYEFFTPTYMNNVFTTAGDLVVSNSAGAPLRIAGNTTTTRKYLSQIGDGTNVTSTTWETVAGGGGLSGSGTANTIAKWTGTSTLNNSGLTDDGSNLIYGSSGFYYDNVNKRLGIGVATPSQALDISANFGIAKITSATGTNAAFFQFVNTGGNFFIGSEGSTGATFGATPYASVIRTPDTVPLEVFQGSWKAVELLTTGQFKWNDYLTATSFTGTAAGYLAFTSTGSIITVPVPSGGGSSLYRIDFNTSPITWSNMPSGLAFFNGSTAYITAAELTNFTQVRFMINKLGTAGSAGSVLILKYSATYTQNVNLWSTIGTSALQLGVTGTNTYLETAWIDLVAGAKGDVFLCVQGSGGNAANDPIFGMITAEFR